MSEQLFTTDTPAQRLAGELRDAKSRGQLRAHFSVLDVEAVLAQPASQPDREALTAIRNAYDRTMDMRPACDDDFYAAVQEALNRVCDSDGNFIAPKPRKVEVTDDMGIRLRSELNKHGENVRGSTVTVTVCMCGRKFATTGAGWIDFNRHGELAALSAALGGGE